LEDKIVTGPKEDKKIKEYYFEKYKTILENKLQGKKSALLVTAFKKDIKKTSIAVKFLLKTI